MCPAAPGDALGGTPAANAASGGHIKKATWLHVGDLALALLRTLNEQAHDNDSHADGVAIGVAVAKNEDSGHEAGEDERHGLCSLGFGEDEQFFRNRLFLANQSSDNAVDQAGWQVVRPLRESLGRDV